METHPSKIHVESRLCQLHEAGSIWCDLRGDLFRPGKSEIPSVTETLLGGSSQLVSG